MAVHERFARGGFRARIDARCVKVREPCVKEQVDHLRDLVDVDLDPAARKPHQAEPKIALVCCHTHSLLQRIALVACRSRGWLSLQFAGFKCLFETCEVGFVLVGVRAGELANGLDEIGSVAEVTRDFETIA